MLNNKIEQDKFEKEVVPLFEKIKFSSNDPFLIPALKDQEEYNYLFYTIFHGAVYKTLLTIKNKKVFSYNEYMDLYNRCITTEVFGGETTIFYFKNPILKVSTYKDKITNLTSEAIYPLYQKTIENDMNILNKIKKDEALNKDIINASNNFSNENNDIDFDDFE